ncbi:MAG: hypothetical protein H6739_09920 [Alphaproteobacteria bacterium]|nr:hypothetical protein [Alphaproteobacteria bacterium]
MTEPLTPLADGLWLATEPVRHLGLHLTATMALMRLGDGTLLAYSPVALTPARREAVAALGDVAHVYAPNLFHHTWAGGWAEAFPDARLHAPAGLSAKRPDLRIDRTFDTDFPIQDTVEELPIDGFRLEERALLHRPSGTLVIADLVHNIGTPDHGWTAAYARAMGFYDRVALSRMIRWTAFSDKAAARRSLDTLLARPFERLVVGHGAPLTEGARAAVEAAYAWL